MNKRHQYNLWYLGGALLIVFAIQLWFGYRSVAPVTYTDLLG